VSVLLDRLTAAASRLMHVLLADHEALNAAALCILAVPDGRWLRPLT
jgi:hypothetical protein